MVNNCLNLMYLLENMILISTQITYQLENKNKYLKNFLIKVVMILMI